MRVYPMDADIWRLGRQEKRKTAALENSGVFS